MKILFKKISSKMDNSRNMILQKYGLLTSGIVQNYGQNKLEKRKLQLLIDDFSTAFPPNLYPKHEKSFSYKRTLMQRN